MVTKASHNVGTHDLLLFVASGVLLNITPGPDMLYIIARSTARGARAGSITARVSPPDAAFTSPRPLSGYRP